jgi:tetratricopeptide (TPR) repeat protein
MHLGRALMDLGQDDEGQKYLAKFQRLRQKKVRGPWKQAGMIESATLSAPERIKREIERLRQDSHAHPDDPELLLHYASLLLADGRLDEATAEFRLLLTRNAENRVWLEAGDFLLGFEQYPLAKEFLERAAAARPAANLSLAVAVFSIDGPAAALKVLERVPEGERSGDYLLMKAKILDAAGQTEESEKILDQGLHLSISQPRIAQQAAVLLLRHGRKDAALDLLTRAAGTDPDLLLTRAIVLGLMDRNAEAEKAVKEIESEWPEWDRPYLAHGLLLEHARPSEAAQKLRTAVALGSRDVAAQCALARLKSAKSSDPQCACAGGLEGLLFPTCTSP